MGRHGSSGAGDDCQIVFCQMGFSLSLPRDVRYTIIEAIRKKNNKGQVYSERWNRQNKTLFIETVELAEGVIVRESRGDL